MKALNDLNIFVETAHQSSFSQAAHSLDVTPAAVSAAIKRLEAQLVKPSDLLSHSCLCFMLSDTYHNRWTFWKAGESETVVVKSQRSANDGDVVRRWAISGYGIAYKSLLDISADIIDERLVPLLPEWQSEPCPVYLVCADKRLLNHPTRALHQFLKQKCEQRMLQLCDIMSQRYSQTV
ncbi:LysR family transcriptional regulator [Vibrio cincinnatiensis]|nr:LysR family transcriptional regulator [Vibrio cincinnatiensis]